MQDGGRQRGRWRRTPLVNVADLLVHNYEIISGIDHYCEYRDAGKQRLYIHNGWQSEQILGDPVSRQELC